MSSGHPTVALLGAGFTTGNHGVGALASGTLTALLHADADARLEFLDYDTEAVVSSDRVGKREVRVETINLRFSKKPWQPNHVARLLLAAAFLRLVPSRDARRKLAARNPWLRRILEAQLHLSIAGGDSFSDIYGMQRLLYVVLPQVLVLWLDKPLVLLPQTYGPFESSLARLLARYVLKRAALVYSRDTKGVDAMRALVGKTDGRIQFAYDMGFALEPQPPAENARLQLEAIKQNGLVAGLNVSGLLYMGGYSRGNMFGLRAEYPRLIHTVLDEMIEKLGVQVLLVPHVFGGVENPESDETACARIFAEFGQRHAGRLHYLPGRFDQHEIKYMIGRCDFFMGSRMHACIGALSQCVPAVGLAYSRKFAGVLDSVGGGSRVVDLRHSDEAQVLAAVREAFGQREVLRRELEEKMPSLRESVLGLFSKNEFRQLLMKSS
ncbi:MAG: polysaccharide pyruvyl transferase family protein [Verrucomicrobia bacterium]|nr:polysaccharide pyruvyl transferase family protein [Verrucomicrobiota bacterium]